jgi:hypothetical protein
MSITAVVHNDTIKLPVHVPDGTEVEITLPKEAETPRGERGALDWLRKHAGTIEAAADLAEQHDHYVHGTPKRRID